MKALFYDAQNNTAASLSKRERKHHWQSECWQDVTGVPSSGGKRPIRPIRPGRGVRSLSKIFITYLLMSSIKLGIILSVLDGFALWWHCHLLKLGIVYCKQHTSWYHIDS